MSYEEPGTMASSYGCSKGSLWQELADITVKPSWNGVESSGVKDPPQHGVYAVARGMVGCRESVGRNATIILAGFAPDVLPLPEVWPDQFQRNYRLSRKVHYRERTVARSAMLKRYPVGLPVRGSSSAFVCP